MQNEPVQIPDTGSGIKGLCTAILVQAVLDYQELCRNGVASVKSKKSGNYSKNEISRFFDSEWCAQLLDTIGGHVSGKDISDILKKQNTNFDKEKKKIAAYSPDGILIKIFDTLSDGADFAGLNTTANISRCCNGRRKTAGGYIWKYI